MSEHQIIQCPNCNQKLRIPLKLDKIKARCPLCRQEFSWDLNSGVKRFSAVDNSKVIKKTKRKKRAKLLELLAFSGMVTIIIIGLVLLLVQPEVLPKIIKLQYNKEWIVISYEDLIDDNQIIRTGDKLKSSLGDPNLKGSIQPIVDIYSFLLSYAVEIINGSDQFPQQNVVDNYPIGSRQPAWVGILRGGRIFITSDYKQKARVFLLGEEPEIEYKNKYSIIRHCLSALLPSNGSGLELEIYAYKNDYQNLELSLNTIPQVLTPFSFPPPKGKIPVDLEGLNDFFQGGGCIEGAQLDKSEGLILYSVAGERQTIAGNRTELSDLAVAYRGVFHAGDNEAFISLDPHIDPVQVKVNFGGFLEDTRIGHAVLEADKRFKTISSGLDPNTFKEIKNFTRGFASTFLTGFERQFLNTNNNASNSWIGTRFWFYPDSIEIQTDLDNRFALITKPRFTADAERSREDFFSLEDFEEKKKSTLLKSDQDCIVHLNLYYSSYANAFQEIRELDTVARLMGLCSWLKESDTDWIDLDCLLSVELPTCFTERERTRLLAISYLSYLEGDIINENFVKNNSKTVFLSPILDSKIEEYFETPLNLSKYICYKNNVAEELHAQFSSEANLLFLNMKGNKVKEIIKTKEDLRAFISFAAEKIEFELPRKVKEYEVTLSLLEKEIDKLESEIDNVEKLMEKTKDIQQYNSYVDKQNQLVRSYESNRSKYNLIVELNNKLDLNFPYLMEISGGINLEPKLFKIKRVPESIQLINFKAFTKNAEIVGKEYKGTAKWMRNRSKLQSEISTISMPNYMWEVKENFDVMKSNHKYIEGSNNARYWIEDNLQNGSWRNMLKTSTETYIEKTYNESTRILNIIELQSGKIHKSINGKLSDKNRIIFTKSNVLEAKESLDKPVWWPIK